MNDHLLAVCQMNLYRVAVGVVVGMAVFAALVIAAVIAFLWVVHFRHLPNWLVSSVEVLLAIGVLLAEWRVMRFLARRRFRFSLRTALAGTAVLALILGIVGPRVRLAVRQQRAIWALHAQRSGANYALVYAGDSAYFQGLIDRLGFDPFGKITDVLIRSDSALSVIVDHREEFADLEGIVFGSGFTDRGLERVGELNRLANLSSATFLPKTAITDAAMKRLAAWTNLQVLMLNGCGHVTDAGLSHLADMPHLECLWLWHETASTMTITDAGLAHVARIPQLRELLIQGWPVTDEGLAHLRGLNCLELLWVRGTSISDAGLQHLETMNLKKLGVNQTNVTDAGLDHLKKIRSLEFLQLGSPGITDEAIRRLWEFPRLKRLGLTGTRVTDAGLEYLQGIKNLEELWLSSAPVTEAGMKRLKQVPRLRRVRIDNMKLSPAFLDELRQAMPGCQIESY